jgi:hypothetical protein
VSAKTTRPQPRPLIGEEGAKRSAALILEVLAGLRTPTEALGVKAMRYYVLERRALEGMVQALAPRPKGKRRRPEDALAEAGREKVRLEREMGRLQALVRAAQRTMGLPPPPSREKAKGDKRRRRRPQVRAVKAMALLRAPMPEPAPTPEAPEASR